jgi:hypothetical protein
MRWATACAAAGTIVLAPACAAHAPAPSPAPCCAAPGYSRAQVEAVLGPPGAPESTKFNPYPSPPPNGQIYTTEHGYLTVTYSSAHGLATRMELDFLEGKAPADAFAIGTSFLPPDTTDTGIRVQGKRESIRLYRSATIARRLPSTHGDVYAECGGVNPAVMCEELVFSLGSP